MQQGEAGKILQAMTDCSAVEGKNKIVSASLRFVGNIGGEGVGGGEDVCNRR